MLHFEEITNLFTKPTTTSSAPQIIPPLEKRDKQSSPVVHVVGREKNVYLIARDDLYPNRTCIELVELLSNQKVQRRTIYVHETKMKCVCASMSMDRTILAYTTYRKKTDQDIAGLYESFFIELEVATGESNRYLFNMSGSSFQSLQFIHDPTNTKKSTLSFLFIRDKGEIKMYNIYTERKKQVTKIVKQPEIQVTFVKKHLWAEWDPTLSVLYYIVLIKDVRVTTISNMTLDCNLRCCSFADSRRPTIVFDYVIPITFSSEVLLDSHFPEYEHYPWRNAHSSPDRLLTFKIVRLSNNAICLCQQEPIIKSYPREATEKVDPIIKVSIFVLHYKTKINLTIPLINQDEKISHRVFFSTLYDYLFLYIPGCFIQLVDCNGDQEPRLSLQLTTQVPNLPHCQQKTSLPVQLDEPGTLLNLRKGIVCKYNLDWERLLKCGNSTILREVIRISTTHLPKDTLSQQILEIDYSSENIAEYVYGTAWMQSKDVMPHLLRYIPMGYSNHLVGSKFTGQCEVYIPKVICTPRPATNFQFIDRLRDIYTHGPMDKKALTPITPTPPPPSQPTFSFKQSIMRMFTSSRDDATPISGEITNFEDADPQFTACNALFINSLIDLLVLTKEYKQQRVRATKVAKDYCSIVNKILQDLFHVKSSNDEVRFQHLEAIYSFCEESCFPVPKGFCDEFSVLGYKILSKHMFLQYVRKDVFTVTKTLYKHVANDLETRNEDDVMSLLLYKLQDKEREIDYYEKMCVGMPHMIDYYHHSAFSKDFSHDELLQKQNQAVDTEVDHRAFAPLSFFLFSLYRGQSNDENTDDSLDSISFSNLILDGVNDEEAVQFIRQEATECLASSGFI